MKLPCSFRAFRALPCTECEATLSVVLAALGLFLSKELNPFFQFLFLEGAKLGTEELWHLPAVQL